MKMTTEEDGLISLTRTRRPDPPTNQGESNVTREVEKPHQVAVGGKREERGGRRDVGD